MVIPKVILDYGSLTFKESCNEKLFWMKLGVPFYIQTIGIKTRRLVPGKVTNMNNFVTVPCLLLLLKSPHQLDIKPNRCTFLQPSHWHKDKETAAWEINKYE